MSSLSSSGFKRVGTSIVPFPSNDAEFVQKKMMEYPLQKKLGTASVTLDVVPSMTKPGGADMSRIRVTQQVDSERDLMGHHTLVDIAGQIMQFCMKGGSKTA
ncbi:MAG: hypothetical protein VKJ06_07855 [Vampirovibrionales bacterium]|nr:hypothetical protein [Vampirovibrionales bacterium]